jgi:lipopolysaccharide export system permease protein
VAETRLPAINVSVLEQAANRARNVRAFAGTTGERLANLAKESGNYRIEIYRKYVQSVAILLMFLIGAPLGAIIKKGGLGVPILVSILFFIVYYILSIMGEKYGREGVMPVTLGMWMSTAALLPFGLFFLYQARNDSGLLDWDLGRFVPAWVRWPFRGYKKVV